MELANLYVRAESQGVKRAEFEVMAKHLEEIISRLGREFLRRLRVEGESELIYYLEQGSLIGSARIIGAAVLATYVTISQYPAFRNGVIQLYEDARTMGNAAIEEFKRITRAREQEIIYRRTISRDVNRLRRIVENIDFLSSGHVPESEAVACRDAIASDIAGLHRAHPEDHSIERLLDLVPRRRIPPIPERMDGIMEMDERRRWLQAPGEEPAGARVIAHRPRTRAPSFRYQRILRL